MRLIEYQNKLKEFPKNLPGRVITPNDLAADAQNEIVGYTMEYLRGAEVLRKYADKGFRSKGITNDIVVNIFRDLHNTVSRVHKVGVVLGDFNYLNVMIMDSKAYIIDADGIQFGKYLCHGFTERFADPRLCKPDLKVPVLYKPHNADSDWYAFAVMLMECLLFIHPYLGGIYRPKGAKKRVPQDARPLERITIFNSDVGYPKSASPYLILPDDLLHYFHRVFDKDKRGVFPLKLVEDIRWTKCSICGLEHARDICPKCAKVPETAIKEKIVIRGKVTSREFFRTGGIILFAALGNDKLCFLYHENKSYRREGGTLVLNGELDQQMRFRLQGESTLIGKGDSLVILDPGKEKEIINVDCFRNLPIFDANEQNYFWVYGGQLKKSGRFGPEVIGEVLPRQTLFWVGPKFGFGFYYAGNLSVSFLFDVRTKGVNDNLKLPRIRGQLVDSTCVFTEKHCWFFTSFVDRGRTINRCVVLRYDGTVEAVSETRVGDGSWLSEIRGKCGVGNSLLVVTDEGIVSVEPEGGKIVKTKEFPDTESFVDLGCHLFLSREGLYVTSSKTIRLLTIKK